MGIQDIVVQITDTADAPSRMEVAIRLAETHGAHLVGLYPLYVPPLPGYVEGRLGADLLAHQKALYRERAEAAEQAFRQASERAGIAFEWRCVEGRPGDVIARSAPYCDLLVMGRHDTDFSEQSLNLVESVVLSSGKPVVVLPDEGVRAPIGRRVMVAWNGSREAVRAVDAALPLLARAEQVDVVAVDPRAQARDAHGAIPGADLSTHLARHGVRVQAQAMDSAGRGVAETLLARAAADGADLLVMGAYGHARWRELVLGGATAHVLRHARLPVLMAH